MYILYFPHALLFGHVFIGYYTALVLGTSTWLEFELLQEDKDHRSLPYTRIQSKFDYRSCRLPEFKLLLGSKYRFTRV